MNEIHVQYQGFHPSEFAREYIDTILSELHERSPYGATLRAVFSRDGDRLKAHLRVQSAAGEFFAAADGRRLREVGRKAFMQIHKQLERWKALRHGGQAHGADVA